MLLCSSWGFPSETLPTQTHGQWEQSIGLISLTYTTTSIHHHGLFSLDRTGGPRRGGGSDTARTPPQILAGSGYCKWFNVRMGFGFISMTSSEGKPVDPPLDVFVHQVSPFSPFKIYYILLSLVLLPLIHVICRISLTSADVFEESRSKHALVFSSPVTLRAALLTPQTHLYSGSPPLI